MKFIYAILLYLSTFIAVGAGAYILAFNSPKFILAEMTVPLAVLGAGLLLTVILLLTFRLSQAPDTGVYSRIGFVSGVIAIIAEIVARQVYSIHGIFFLLEFINAVSFDGVGIALLSVFALSAAVSGYAILLTLCEYTTNRGSYLSERNLPVAAFSILASALSIVISASSLAIIVPPFMAFWYWLHAKGFGDYEGDKRLKKRAIVSSIVTVTVAVALFLIPFKAIMKSGDFTYEYSDVNEEYCSVRIEGKNGGLSELAIPSEYEGKKVGVLTLGGGIDNLEYITIPETVFEANLPDSHALKSLVSITVDESNEYYKAIDGALYTKTGKTLVLLPSTITDYTVPSGVTSIENGLDKLRIKRITFSDELTLSGTMQDFAALEYVSLGKAVTSIPAEAFNKAASLTAVEFRGDITEIGSKAFYECTSLKSITLPSSVTKVGANAFFGCSSLSSVSLNEGLTSIGEYAFTACAALTSIKIPSTLSTLPVYAFSDCTALASADIEHVTSFKSTTFRNTALLELQLPDCYVGEIDNTYSFGDFFRGFVGGEGNTKYIAYEGAIYEKTSASHDLIFKPHAITDLKLYNLCNSIDGTYEDVTKLTCGSAFTSALWLYTYFPNLTELTLGSGLLTFDRAHMPETLAYISITEHNYVKSENGILYTPHYSTEVTASVYIPPMMKNVVLPDEIDILQGAIKDFEAEVDGGFSLKGDQELFSNVVESLTLGESLNSVKFANKDKITEYIGDDTCYNSKLANTPLKKLVIKGSDTKIGEWSFAGCGHLDTVIFESESESGEMTIGIGAFYNCSSLMLEVLPDCLYSVDKYALKNTSCKTLSFGARLTNLERSALPECCEYVSMRGDNDVLYNMNGALVYRGGAKMVIPSSIKRIILTPSEYDLANTVGSTHGLYSLEYVELSEGAEFDTPVIGGVVYVKNGTSYTVNAPKNLKEFIVPRLDMPLRFPAYQNYYCFDKISLGENVTDFVLIKGSLYTADGKSLVATGKWTDGRIYLSDGVDDDFLGVSPDYLFDSTEDLSVVLGKNISTNETMSLLNHRRTAAGASAYFVYNAITEPTNVYSEWDLSMIYSKIDVYFYSEEKPKPTDTVKYWHFDENGLAVIWE